MCRNAKKNKTWNVCMAELKQGEDDDMHAGKSIHPLIVETIPTRSVT